MKKNLSTKGTQLEAKRLHHILSFVTSLNNPLCNPNLKEGIIKSNPILIICAYNELLELQKEVNGLEIDIESINVDRIFKRQYANEIERYIASLRDGLDIAYAKKDYNKMIELESLNEFYPYNERMNRKNFLELEIDKRLQAQAKLAKIAPELAKNENRAIQEMQKELQSLLETLDMPTREELRLKLYSIANYYLEHLKKMIDTKIEYLEELLKEI